MKLPLILVLVVTANPVLAQERADTPLMTWTDLTSRPLPVPSDTHRYSEGDAGVVDVWLPDGPGPHPTVVMIHGGCWQKGIADRTLMNYAADALRTRGLAVWNIEYRGVDEDGGGYPGTFLDVAAAIDAIRDADPAWRLDTSRVVAFGHSAGAHLAAWASVRAHLPKGSVLYAKTPLTIHAVVNSGGSLTLRRPFR